MHMTSASHQRAAAYQNKIQIIYPNRVMARRRRNGLSYSHQRKIEPRNAVLAGAERRFQL